MMRQALIVWNDAEEQDGEPPWLTTFGIDIPEDKWDAPEDDYIFFYIDAEDFKVGFDSGDFTIVSIKQSGTNQTL